MVKGVYRLLVATILLLLPVGVFGQKAEELQNSYNFKRGSELLFGENPAGIRNFCVKYTVNEY